MNIREYLRLSLVSMSMLLIPIGGCEETTAPYTPELIPFSLVPCLRDSFVGFPPQAISSEAQLDSILPDRLCSDTLIDFSQYTLLYQNAAHGGCDAPFYEASVTKDVHKREITFKLRIIEHGYCSIAIIQGFWVLIPKVPAGYQVIYQKEKFIEWSAA